MAEVTLSDGSFSIGSTTWPGVSKLIEEMGELGQVLGKLIATHGAPEHWDGGGNLIDRLHEELGDVLGAVSFVIEQNGMDAQLVQSRAARKMLLFREWQEDQG